MKTIHKKTYRMKQIEEEYGIPIETLIHKLYVLEGLSYLMMSKKLSVRKDSCMQWVARAGIYSGKLNLTSNHRKIY